MAADNIRDYLPEVEMEVGEQVHVFHCATGKDNDRLYIKRTEHGYIYHCKHCGYSGGIGEGKHKYSRVKERLKRKGSVDSVTIATSSEDSEGVRLPYDSSGDVKLWPSRAKVWVYRGQLTDKELKDYGFVYSEHYDRVFYPVYNNGVIKCTIGRRLKDDGTPKYLIYKDKGFNNLWYTNPLKCDQVCIVEDVLSGIRCSRFVASAALLGTSFSDSAISYLVNRHKKFIIFLDDDKPQVKMKQVELKNKLELFGDVKLITRTGKDPKEMSDAMLKGILL